MVSARQGGVFELARQTFLLKVSVTSSQSTPSVWTHAHTHTIAQEPNALQLWVPREGFRSFDFFFFSNCLICCITVYEIYVN